MSDLWTQWQALREQPSVPELSALPATIPELTDYQVGVNVGPRVDNWHFGVTATFPDFEALDRYVNHPDHLAAVANAIDPIRAEVVRVQYEI